jgi:hypothetical protein
MRQGQQHRRGRGRNNNNNNHRSKGHNPLSRSFESNGPDVKVRGTPAHIAEKYLSLARDAQSSGDPVLAENYFQHAEHYNRIIMAYREQQMQQQPGEAMNGSGGPRGRPFEGADGEEALEGSGDDLGHSDQPSIEGYQPEQPRFGGQRGDEDRPYRHDHGRFRDRNDRQNRHDRPYDRQNEMRSEVRQGRDRPHEGQGREGQARDRAGEGQAPPPSDPAQQAQPRAEPARRRERFGPGNEQPEFLRRPVRRPRREEGNGNGEGEDTGEAGREDGPQDKTPA